MNAQRNAKNRNIFSQDVCLTKALWSGNQFLQESDKCRRSAREHEYDPSHLLYKGIRHKA